MAGARVGEELAFFDAPWCAQALEVANTTPAVRAGLADAATFDVAFAFECTDHVEICSWVEFRAGTVHGWYPGPAAATGYLAVARASAGVWRSAAEGEAYGTDLLLGHKIKIRDPRNRIAANYQAFEALLASWVDVPTAWP